MNTEYKELPNNIEAEQALLGSLLINNQGLDEIGDYLKAEHFYHTLHKQIYQIILNTINKGLLANPVTLKPNFTDNEGLKELGGIKYLIQLATNADKIINIKYYADIIYKLYIDRNLISFGNELVENAYNSNIDTNLKIENIEKKLFNLAEKGSDNNRCEKISNSLSNTIEIVENAIKNKGVNGISTGFTDLDNLLGGLKNSDLIILAARPSMGKTALATSIAYKASQYLKEQDNKTICLFSLEMSSEQLSGRILSLATGINSSNLFRGRLSNDEFSQIVDKSVEISNLPILIDDTPALTISALRTKIRRLKRQHNISLVLIDYLQLLSDDSITSNSNRVQEVSNITRGLKIIAKEMNIPIIALSQLSRAVEQREDKRPLLSDLRESGSIEQDADIVMFLYREEYYLSRKEPSLGTEKYLEWQSEVNKVRNTAELIIAKHRNGAIGKIQLYFNQNTTCFSDLDKIYNEGNF